MKRLLLNLILLTTTIVGTLFIITYDVHAEENNDYPLGVPDDYECQNYVIEYNRVEPASDGSGTTIYSYYADFDVYYDNILSVVPVIFQWNTYNKYVPELWIYNNNNNNNNNVGVSSLDLYSSFENKENGVLYQDIKIYPKNSDAIQTRVYARINDFHYTTSVRSLNKNNCSDKIVYMNTFDMLNNFYYNSGTVEMTLNEPFIYRLNNSTTYYFCESVVGEYSSSISSSSGMDLVNFYNDNKSVYYDTEYLDPVFNKAIRLGDTGTIQLLYKLDPNKKKPIKVSTYGKLFVKLQGDVNWKIVDSTDILSLSMSDEKTNVSGIFHFPDITDALGLDTATYEAIIWGCRYTYYDGVSGKELTSKVYNTPWVFSRYVLTENVVVEEKDVVLDDLGNLTDISNSVNSSDVIIDNVTNTSGSSSDNSNNSFDSNIIIDDTSINSMSDFINSLKWDFSSISNAIGSVFSLVVQFAGFIGNIFSAFFGEPFFIIVMLAIGCAIILRVLGR